LSIGEDFPGTLEAARAGGEWAWKALYDDLAPQVLGYLRAKGAKDPEDVLGEVFLQVVRDLPRFAGEERDFRAWMFVIAHHRLLDDVRSRSRRPVEAVDHDQLVRSGPVGHGEDEAINELVTGEVAEMLSSLSRDQAEVLTLRIVGDMRISEIAEALGKKPGAVQALQRRGIKALRRRLSRSAPPDTLIGNPGMASDEES
jgi:RNA polymerase sigma factor (sigma-70 family)